MANVIKIKRTSVTGRAANTTTLPNAGELALNMADGILYSTNGTNVFEIGANTTNSKVTGTLTVNAISSNGTVGTAGQILTSNGTTSYWSSTANNASNLGGVAASGYQTTAGLAANVATLAANSATYLGSSVNSGNSTGIYSTGVITASGFVTGLELHSTMASGDEGGEIKLAKPPNATTDGGITIDAYQNKLRIFEQGGSARGVYIDLTAAAGGVGTNLLGGTGTVSNVATGNGLTGGPITTTGTISVLANTGIVANTTGLYVNAAYINTISANSATYINGNTASDLNTYADNKAANAYSNAVSYADNKAANAYSNATSYADNKAANAYSNATSYADNKAANAYSNAVSYVDGKSYVNTSQLSSNLSNYAALAGATFTGALAVTNTVTITGNLVVTGTTISANVTNLDVKDLNITVAKGAATNAATDGAGLTVDTSNIGWYYNYASNTWQANVGITPSSNLAYNLGTTGLYWANVYANNIVSVNLYGTLQTASQPNITANLATYIVANTGLVSNASGVYVNAAYINTISSNNASYLGGTAAASYQLNSTLAANVATLAANSATYVLANSGIVSNSYGVFVKGNTGLVVNSAGVFVNSSYIGTLSANNASYLGGVAANGYANTSNPIFTTGVTVGNATVNIAISTSTLKINGETAVGQTAITAGTYGNSTAIPVITLDKFGRVTTISTSAGGSGAFPTGDYGDLTSIVQDAFGVNIIDITQFDCGAAGAVSNTDLGTAASI